MLTSTLSSKGQVTIPQPVRERLGLREGDRVEFVFEEGRTILRPVRQSENRIRQWIGAFENPPHPEGSVAWVRNMRDEDEAGS